MNPLIKKQLDKVTVADLSFYDPERCIFSIPKYEKSTYTVGCCYLVRIPNEYVNNNSSLLATNWNNGTSPQTGYLSIRVNEQRGNMIYSDCLSLNEQTNESLNLLWSGWLYSDDIEQIMKIS